MPKILHELMRFIGMNAPSQSVRIAMYRKAGIRIGKCTFGNGIWLDVNSHYKSMISIEDDVLLSGHILILSHSFLLGNHGYEGWNPVIIKKGARIGFNVVILAGVIIGENSIVGAGAVVANNIPPNCLAVGVPAKPVRYFTSNRLVNRETMLYVKCKTCGIEFWPSIQCDKQIFKTLDLRGDCIPCPNGHRNQYEKRDYYYEARSEASLL
jgi:acetyltransferase-like isoleucine patch superfamily enzyme